MWVSDLGVCSDYNEEGQPLAWPDGSNSKLECSGVGGKECFGKDSPHL